MPFDPTDAIAEVQGQRASQAVDPTTSDFLCPYIKKRCPKRSTNLGEEPYPVCSLWKNSKVERQPTSDLICVCPKRFYQVDWLKAVVENCWPFSPPVNPVVATEVKMKGFGNVDFVIADQDADGSIGNFLSVELQAIDITGSVFPAYQALRAGEQLPKRPTYGFNWDNVYKRYITQLIRKGYFHHHWGTKIVAVIQDQVYQYVIDKADFMRSDNVADNNVNIIFMTYVFEDDPEKPGQFRPKLQRVEGTSHASLQQAILYKEAPSKDAFKGKIVEALTR
ncbi:NotI family restriction endonuclease [uncultured Roseovarius sp.]|uniref:NotI family restriction endonuclease n=1 Tax=uncultured Roseovarius sp. TaxID=293344 RepID=UPI00262C0499|nr:NotI family restriction endonuclease [uncultured Roseovarius sp.]